MLGPIVTVKVLAIVGVVVLAPTVQTIEVAVVVVTLQLIPSIEIIGVPALRLVPVRVKLYPPKTSPYLGLSEVTIGVASSLYSRAPAKVLVLRPSL